MNAPARTELDRNLPWYLLGLSLLVGSAAPTGIRNISRKDDRDRQTKIDNYMYLRITPILSQ
jgi:hypothetical protein